MRTSKLNRSIAVVSLALAGAILTGCATAKVTQQFDRSVKSDTKSKVGGVILWEQSECETIRARVVVSDAPKNGTATVVPVDPATLASKKAGCKPNERAGHSITYEPNAGFLGTDQFKISIVYLGNSQPSDIWEFNVTVGR
jgi:hypothetical protein